MTQPCFRPTVEALDDRRVPSAVGMPRQPPTPSLPTGPIYPQAALAGLEAQLNQDPEAQAQFLADPGRALRQAGVQLPPAQVQALRGALTQVTAPLPDVPGASVSPLSGLRQVVFDEN
jgi:hypothetical protein